MNSAMRTRGSRQKAGRSVTTGRSPAMHCPERFVRGGCTGSCKTGYSFLAFIRKKQPASFCLPEKFRVVGLRTIRARSNLFDRSFVATLSVNANGRSRRPGKILLLSRRDNAQVIRARGQTTGAERGACSFSSFDRLSPAESGSI